MGEEENDLSYNPGNMYGPRPANRAKIDIFDVDDSHAQVCSKLPKNQILKHLKNKFPGEWRMANWYYDTPNPDPCEDAVHTHKHYLFIKD